MRWSFDALAIGCRKRPNQERRCRAVRFVRMSTTDEDLDAKKIGRKRRTTSALCSSHYTLPLVLLLCLVVNHRQGVEAFRPLLFKFRRRTEETKSSLLLTSRWNRIRGGFATRQARKTLFSTLFQRKSEQPMCKTILSTILEESTVVSAIEVTRSNDMRTPFYPSVYAPEIRNRTSLYIHNDDSGVPFFARIIETQQLLVHPVHVNGEPHPPSGVTYRLASETAERLEPAAASIGTEELPKEQERRGPLRFLFRRRHALDIATTNSNTSRAIWRHRHARSAEEGIRRERTLTTPSSHSSSARRLSSVLATASGSIEKTSRRMAARTLTGLITALAEEVEDLDVEVDARDDTPYHSKYIDAVRIKFSRLVFKPLRMGGHELPERRHEVASKNKLFDKFRLDNGKIMGRNLMRFPSWSNEDKDAEDYDGEPRLTADEAFDRIDVDNSGFLDREELIQALSLAASTSDDNTLMLEDMESESNLPILEKLAADLFELYDVNGDGVVDRREYKTMVEDMAALRKAQWLSERRQTSMELEEERARKERENQEGWMATAIAFAQNNTGFIATGVHFVQNKTGFLATGMKLVQNKTGFIATGMELAQNMTGWLPWGSGEKDKPWQPEGPSETSASASSLERMKRANTDASDISWKDEVVHVFDSPEVVERVSKTLGSITFSDIKMDLRRLFFGAIPILKRIVPGGPLILEPFTTTITGSFDREDIMNSFLLDAGLRRLVMRALRRRVGFFRDFLEGAMFKGRSWKTFGGEEGPRVEIPELTNVEFDENDKLIITGRARVKTSPESPVIDQSFKVRTSIGTRKNGRFIRLEEPELALVIECPESWERNIESICDALNIEKPPRPKPLYSFFPIYSPFKLQDDDGFDLGEDNSVTSLYIKDGALRFEMSAVLRPGRFLGSHYIAFSIPIRTFIITMDRVTEGIRSARKVKKAARALKQASERRNGKQEVKRLRRIDFDRAEDALLARQEERMKKAATSKRSKMKSFFSRFVDGYLQAERDEAKKERLTTAIRDFFGSQGS